MLSEETFLKRFVPIGIISCCIIYRKIFVVKNIAYKDFPESFRGCSQYESWPFSAGIGPLNNIRSQNRPIFPHFEIFWPISTQFLKLWSISTKSVLNLGLILAHWKIKKMGQHLPQLDTLWKTEPKSAKKSLNC